MDVKSVEEGDGGPSFRQDLVVCTSLYTPSSNLVDFKTERCRVYDLQDKIKVRQ